MKKKVININVKEWKYNNEYNLSPEKQSYDDNIDWEEDEIDWEEDEDERDWRDRD